MTLFGTDRQYSEEARCFDVSIYVRPHTHVDTSLLHFCILWNFFVRLSSMLSRHAWGERRTSEREGRCNRHFSVVVLLLASVNWTESAEPWLHRL